MFDSHCHLHDQRLAAQQSQVIERAKTQGVTGVLLAGVCVDTWCEQNNFRKTYENPDFSIGVAYGIHPNWIPKFSIPSDIQQHLAVLQRVLTGQIFSNGKANAVGEIGLDVRGPESQRSLADQVTYFRAQLALARDLELPVVFHIVSAHSEAIHILKNDRLPKSGGVIHSYSGSAEFCLEYLKLGLHISFAGGITNSRAKKMLAAAKIVPGERLLVETDAPDQTPKPYVGWPCESAFLPLVLSALARTRGEVLEELSRTTEQNARRLFHL